MKIFHCLYGSAAIAAGVALLSSATLRAQQLAPSTPAPAPAAPAAQPPGGVAQPPGAAAPAAQPAAPAGPLLVIPNEWKVTVQNADTPYTPGAVVTTPNNDPKAVALLYSAWNGVETYASMVRVVVTHFKAYGPTLANGGAMGIESESAGFLQSIIAQGYVPSAEQTTNGTTPGNKFTVTIEVTAKNTAGDERIFTYTALMGGSPEARYALYTSRPANNAGSNAEMETIIKSFNPPDGPPAQPIAAAGGAPGAAQPPGAAPGAAQAPASNSVSAIDPEARVSDQAAQIVKDYHNALVMVEGNKGVGSGFLCKMEDGKFYVVTNAHVLADNYGVKLTSLDGTGYTAGASAVAVDHDIVKMQIAVPAGAPPPKAFEVMASLDSAVKIGDAVMIPGNAEGAQVVHPVEGKIVGLGPNLIEVDAPFVKGNSGSPIIHEASGKVIGVATYLMQRKVRAEGDNGAPGNNAPPGSGPPGSGGPAGGGGRVVIETRRFGYRIDNVKQWQVIDWRIFFAESQQVSAIEDLSEDFITMFNDMERGGISPSNYKSTTMTRVVRNFMKSLDQLSATASATDRQAVLRGFFADLRAATRGDIADFDARPSYDYFRKDVDDEAHFRDELYEVFTHVVQEVSR
ncbi:MAG TPA: serine protease [Chthoniobacteraceae bacterium]|nr:serine protease [Chthoniobacteraceae bacterium]